MTSHSFFCQLCKNEKTVQNKNKIIVYDIQNDIFVESNICLNCMMQLTTIMRKKELTKEMQQIALDKWSMKI